MAPAPLAVALVWHMHQPWYRDDVAGHFVLPWVRRRASKDYLHMLRILERHPDVRVTMNMVPSLLAQLEMYDDPGFVDVDRELCMRAAVELTPAEVAFLVATARHDDYGRRVALLQPYVDLVERLTTADLAAADRDQVRDLQLWRLLAWIDPADVGADAELAALAGRGGGFSEEDKRIVDERQLALVRAVVPAYRRALDRGQVEPMTSPYHHPILPLLIDSRSALVASPGAAIPEPAFCNSADAEQQVRRGLATFARVSGHQAHAMWPPECAVSPAAAALMARCGVRVAVSDEGVLARTLASDVRAGGALYRVHEDGGGLAMVFRDAELSNLIGFTYQSWPADAAAADLVARLEEIASVHAVEDGAVVTVALDGENFKDFYAENATPFLDALYTRLAASPALRTVHLAEAVDAAPPTPLPELWTGSWVGADLRTWIGDPAHTRAWSALEVAARAVDAAGGAAAHPRARDEVLVAEASDWFWWFGEHHDSGFDAAWDALFRAHLRNAYATAGLAVPPLVDEPFLDAVPISGSYPPLRTIDPAGAGRDEWRCAGIAVVGERFGAMRPPASSVTRVAYGAGGGRVHLRFEGGRPAFERVAVDAGLAGRLVVERPVRNLAIEFDGAEADLVVTLEESGRGVERVPASGALRVQLARAARPLRVVVAAVECAPLCAVGDLAERVAATIAELARLGHEVIAVVPRHRASTLGQAPGRRIERLRVSWDGTVIDAAVLQGTLEANGVPALSIDCAELFDRAAPYGEPDDAARYLSFCALAAAALEATCFQPDVVHGFEWQTAALLARYARDDGGPATVLGAEPHSPHHRVDAKLSRRAGLDVERDDDVDLLDLGRRTATAVVTAAEPLAEVYERAVALRPVARERHVPGAYHRPRQ